MRQPRLIRGYQNDRPSIFSAQLRSLGVVHAKNEADTASDTLTGRLISGVPQKDIVSALRADETPGPRGTGWNRTMILRILKRAGAMPERIREYRKRERRKVQRDKKLAEARAKELRAEGLSLRAIAERLLKEGLYPPRGEQWYAATVAELLSVKGADEAAVRARELRAEGYSFREIGRRLLYEGYLPVNQRAWQAQAVANLLSI
jgi:hypothetical protein